MSPTIHKSKEFLLLLLHEATTKRQAQCLLGTASEHQLNAITEIIHNISSPDFHLDNKVKTALSRNEKKLKPLTIPSVSYKRRLSVVINNTLTVLKILLDVKHIVLELLAE